MLIKYLSDLHLDASNMDFSTLPIDKSGRTVDAIILAGDIAVYRQLLSRLFMAIPEDMPVIFVPGNHEFEEYEFKNVEKDLIELVSSANFHVLQNNTLILNGVRFIGSTLWSDLKFNGDSLYEANVEQTELILRNQFCYHFKNGKKTLWGLNDMLEQHKISREYLTQEIHRPFDGKTVVITHFAPHHKSCEKHHKLSGFWCNNLDDLVGIPEFWIHGHIHSTSNYIVGNTNVLANPRGYSPTYNLSQNINFDPYATFVV